MGTRDSPAAVPSAGDYRTTQPMAQRLVRIARDWWPVVAFLSPVLLLQAVWSAQYDVAGHAAGHLGSAMVVFPMLFVCAVLIWALPEQGRRDPWLWLIFAVILGGCLVVMAGNIQVVDAIGGDTWSDAQAGQLGALRQGFESGHDLAERGAWGVVLAAIVAAGLLWRRRLVSTKAAVAAGALSLIFPYWIVPGFGIVVLAVSVMLARGRRLRAVAGTAPKQP